MKAILQRVSSASVTVDRQLVSTIQRGVLVFAAVAPDDTPKEIERMAEKVVKMKLWADEAGNGQALEAERDGYQGRDPLRQVPPRKLLASLSYSVSVSQFTLLANTKKGNKPDFHGAAGEQHARLLYETFVDKVRANYEGEKVKDGVFQAMMDVGLVNDGPVTLELEVTPIQKQGKKLSNMKSGVSDPQSEASTPG